MGVAGSCGRLYIQLALGSTPSTPTNGKYPKPALNARLKLVIAKFLISATK
jgi:hypothetical protein